MPSPEDTRWLEAAARLAARGRPLSRPNPAVGAILVKRGKVIARGWTQPTGRPHAEAMALSAAGDAAKGATLYVTLEPCAHQSKRGPACADLVANANLVRVVAGCHDPDPRTAGAGLAHIRASGTPADLIVSPACEESLAGYLTRARHGRPHVTLKLALSLDGCIALESGESQWITGPAARAHCHALRARSDAILIGGETLRTDQPSLTVRLPGLESRSPERWVLTRHPVPQDWHAITNPAEIAQIPGAQYLFIEGGAQTAAAFLRADLVDTLAIYRAPILIGAGRPGIADIGLTHLSQAHHRWHQTDRRPLGSDTLEVYQRTRT